MSEQNDLRIIGVALVEPSLRTHQVLNNLDTGVYPVMITLSRPADAFDAKFLRENLGIVVGNDDPMEALLLDTSIDALKANLDQLNGSIALAAVQAAKARADGLAEDERRKAVADELHRQVSPS
jgi:hypothetical protein